VIRFPSKSRPTFKQLGADSLPSISRCVTVAIGYTRTRLIQEDFIMPKPYKTMSTKPLPLGAEIFEKSGTRYVRIKAGSRYLTCKLTADGKSYLRPSKCYYFDIRGKRFKGVADLKATQELADKKQREVDRRQLGLSHPSEDHIRRPLVEHLKDYAAALEAKGDTEGHVKKTIALLTALFKGAGFLFPGDLDSSKAAQWLNTLRRDGEPINVPEGDSFTPGEVAKLLGISTTGLNKNIKRRGLTATGNGKARRIPRAAVEVLANASVRGIGPAQCNHHVKAAKGFSRWMHQTHRLTMNPFQTMTLLNTSSDIRHARRELTATELQRVRSVRDRWILDSCDGWLQCVGEGSSLASWSMGVSGSCVSVSRSQRQGSMPNCWQVAVKLAKVASVRPPRSLPKNSQFLRPIANGLIARSAVLLSIARRPSPTYTFSVDHWLIA
jgi:excisionase family DNA binding protein